MHLEDFFFGIDFGWWCFISMKKLMRDAWHLLVLALKALQIPWEKPPLDISEPKKKRGWISSSSKTCQSTVLEGWNNCSEWSTRAGPHLNRPLPIEAWTMTNTYPDNSQCIIRLKTHGWSRWWTHRGTHLVDCDAHRIMKQIDSWPMDCLW